MCRPAVNADIRFSKNCRSWYDPKSPKNICIHNLHVENILVCNKYKINEYHITTYKYNLATLIIWHIIIYFTEYNITAWHIFFFFFRF